MHVLKSKQFYIASSVPDANMLKNVHVKCLQLSVH